MELSEEAIKEYQSIMLAEYGVEISREEAIASATNLIGLYKAVYGISDSSSPKRE